MAIMVWITQVISRQVQGKLTYERLHNSRRRNQLAVDDGHQSSIHGLGVGGVVEVVRATVCCVRYLGTRTADSQSHSAAKHQPTGLHHSRDRLTVNKVEALEAGLGAGRGLVLGAHLHTHFCRNVWTLVSNVWSCVREASRTEAG